MTVSGDAVLTYDYKSAVTFSFTIAGVASSPASCAIAYTTGLQYYALDFTDNTHTVLDTVNHQWTLPIMDAVS